MKQLLPLIGMIMCMSGAQIFLKFAGLYLADSESLFQGFALNRWLWMAIAFSVAGVYCWLRALRRMPLSLAYPWTSLIYLITPVAGAVIFSEALTTRYAFGIILILCGIVATRPRSERR